jgi:glutaredoxin
LREILASVKPLAIEILRTPSCPHGRAVGRRIDELARDKGIAVTVTETIVDDAQVAQALRFPGSPTILIDGQDVEPRVAGAPADYGLG